MIGTQTFIRGILRLSKMPRNVLIGGGLALWFWPSRGRGMEFY